MMTPDRLQKLKEDPIPQILAGYDRQRRWIVIEAGIIAALVLALFILAFAYRDLRDYLKEPAGRENRLEYQCQVEKKLGLPPLDCDE